MWPLAAKAAYFSDELHNVKWYTMRISFFLSHHHHKLQSIPNVITAPVFLSFFQTPIVLFVRYNIPFQPSMEIANPTRRFVWKLVLKNGFRWIVHNALRSRNVTNFGI